MSFTTNLGRKPFTDIVEARNFAATFPAFTGRLKVHPDSSTYELEDKVLTYPARELAIHNLTLFRSLLVAQENRFFRVAYLANKAVRLQIFTRERTTAYSYKMLEWHFVRDMLYPSVGYEWARYLDYDKNVAAGWALYNEALVQYNAAAFVCPKQVKFTPVTKSLDAVTKIPEDDLVPYDKFWREWSFV